jgi:hypothetical protein
VDGAPASNTARLAPHVNTLAVSLAVLLLGGLIAWFVGRRRNGDAELPSTPELELATTGSLTAPAAAARLGRDADVIDLDRQRGPWRACGLRGYLQAVPGWARGAARTWMPSPCLPSRLRVRRVYRWRRQLARRGHDRGLHPEE